MISAVGDSYSAGESGSPKKKVKKLEPIKVPFVGGTVNDIAKADAINE